MEQACDLFRRCVTRRTDEDWYQLTRCYGPIVRNMFRQALARYDLILSDQDLEEYVQELYLRLLTTRAGQFRGRSDAELWQYLGCMAQNMVTDHWRVLARHQKIVAHETMKRARCIVNSAASPEERAMVRQSFVLFLDSCRWAARGFRIDLKVRVMGLAYLQGCTSREIAHRLSDQVTPKQVDTMIFRLRRHLAQRGLDIPYRQFTGVSRLPPQALPQTPETFIHR